MSSLLAPGLTNDGPDRQRARERAWELLEALEGLVNACEGPGDARERRAWGRARELVGRIRQR